MLISHPKEGNIQEKRLIDHLKNVAELSSNEIENKIISSTLITKDRLKELAVIIGLFHDFGKATTWFQEYIRGNGNSNLYIRHSLVSAIVAYYVALLKGYGKKWAYMVFQIILRHHSNLSAYEVNSDNFNFAIVQKQLKNIRNNSFNELRNFYSQSNIDLESIFNRVNLNDFNEFLTNIDDNIIDKLSEQTEEEALEFFFINNYLFSLLIDFDKKDAARLDNSYFDGNLEEEENDVFSYLEECRKKYYQKFDPEIPINKLRNKFLNEIKNNENITTNNHFYSITAPTGIGKTFGCLVFANKLIKKLKKELGQPARIIYTLPYTSIIDQNYLEFEKIISFNKKVKYQKCPTRYLLKHHYLSPKIVENRIGEENRRLKDYLDDQLLVESWLASMIVTTYVQFLHTIFGYQNRFLKKFHNIVNSIIIFDEVQNIDPQYYLLIQKSFKVLAEIFNIYFLLATATQPEIFPQDRLIELVDYEKNMRNSIFNRVKMDVNTQQKTLDDFTEKFIDSFRDNNCLVVMNTKGVAIDFYSKIKEKFEDDYKIYCLTTYLTPYDRNRKIREIKKMLKNNEKIIVISTQLVEAGVDLSFKRVFRDFGPIDSIIQVAGRCNRSGELDKLGGLFTLINLSNTSIYSQALIQYTKEVFENLNKDKYESKDFIDLSKRYFEKFNFNLISENIMKAIKEMNYDIEYDDQIPVSKFKLIPQQNQRSIYLLHTEEAERNMKKLLELRKCLLDTVEKEKKEKLIMKIEKLKYQLIKFKISVYPNELNVYLTLIEPQEEISNNNFKYLYISKESCDRYVYDESIGFLKEPKEKLKDCIFI